MRIDSVPAFLDALRRSRLLSTVQMNYLKSALLPQAADFAALADLLVQHGLLTEYQAEMLLAGSDEPLVLSPYHLLDLVGEGGVCKVFKAIHTQYGDIVAVKVVHAELRSNINVMDQFRVEMEIIATIDHPKFVKALDYQRVGDIPFFVMEFIDGMDLMRLVERVGPLPMTQACQWIHQAALGFQHAFETGLVHRDVKPANLIAAYENEQLYILDIGLARLEWSYRDASATYTPATQGAALLGTPDYVAPEQALNPHEADIRADIYGLGCTLYHMLTGEPPFPGGSLARKLLAHQTTPPPSVRSKRPELPQELAAIVQKMMAKNPADRYKTPAAVAVALSPFTHGTEKRVILRELRPRRGPLAPLPGAHRLTAAPPQPAPAPRPAANYGQPGGPPERRTHPRRAGNPTPVLISASPDAPDVLHGWVINRSAGGLGLLVAEPLEILTDLYVRPENEIFHHLCVPVRIVYCFQERLQFRVGCQFLEPVSWTNLRAFG
jgi:serine/threonine protein kinase